MVHVNTFCPGSDRCSHTVPSCPGYTLEESGTVAGCHLPVDVLALCQELHMNSIGASDTMGDLSIQAGYETLRRVLAEWTPSESAFDDAVKVLVEATLAEGSHHG